MPKPPHLNRRLARLAAGLLAATAPATAATEPATPILVLRSSGPSLGRYPPGATLQPGRRIALRAGDAVVLLDTYGAYALRGPGTFPVDRTPAYRRRRPRLDDPRSPPDPPPPAHPPTLWDLDVAGGGTFCVLAQGHGSLRLWRRDPSAAADLIIAPAVGGGPAQRLTWPQGGTSIDWPAALPVRDGAEYDLAPAGDAAAVTRVRFRTMAEAPTSVRSAASALIARGCHRQIDLLIEAMSGDPVPRIS